MARSSNKYIVLLFVWLVTVTLATAQRQIPVIYSFTSDIDIRIDGRLVPQKFTLLPQNRPDVLRLDPWGGARTIAFITDIDSAEIKLEDTAARDLWIILRGKDSCLVRIVNQKRSYFTSRAYGYTLLAVALLVVLGYGVFGYRLPEKVQLSTGWLAAVYFWVALFVAGLLQKNYDHVSMPIGGLGEMGSGSEFFFSSSLFVVSLLVACFGFTLGKQTKEFGRVAVLFFLLVLTPLVFFVPMLFPVNQQLKVVGGPNIIHIVVLQLVSLVTWLRQPSHALIRKYTWACIAIFSLTLALHLLQAAFLPVGLFQRLLHVNWTLWFLVLSLSFLHRLREPEL